MSTSRLLVWACFAVVLMGRPALAQEPKAIDAPVLPKYLGERVRVTFKVELAAPTAGNTVNLHSMKEWADPKSFWVVLTPAALDAYRKLGVKDAASHFSGKTIQVEGVIGSGGLVKNDKNKVKPLMSMIVDNPSQIRLAKSRWETPEFQAWMKDVAAMPAPKQVNAVAKKLKELNPGFDGTGLNDRGEPVKIEKGQVTEIQLYSDKVSDISPLRALGGLKKVIVASAGGDFNGTVADLSPLQGLRLTSLDVHGGRGITDLSPLRGMPLTHLNVWLTPVSDLSTLKGLPLTSLKLSTTNVTDLSPLRGMPLTSLDCTGLREVPDLSPLQGMRLTKLWTNHMKVADLAPLRGMPLEYLEANFMPNLSDLSPLKGMPLTVLEVQQCPKLTDLSPIRGMPLKAIRCDLMFPRDGKLLRSIKSLERINGKPAAEILR